MHLGFIGLALLLVLAGSSAAAQAQPVPSIHCRYDAETEVLSLIGPTDAAMLDCVQAMAEGGARAVRINSTGGSVDTALSIAEIIADWDAHIIVVRQCNSSCANYFLPVARRVTVSPGATVMLHGSIDPGLVSGLDDAAQRQALQAVADRQADFAARHDIPPGWLLYRTEYRGGLRGVHGLRGALLGDVPLTRPSQLIVAEIMFRSCLPHVELDPFDRTTADRAAASEVTRRQLARQGAHVSGSLRCMPDRP